MFVESLRGRPLVTPEAKRLDVQSLDAPADAMLLLTRFEVDLLDGALQQSPTVTRTALAAVAQSESVGVLDVHAVDDPSRPVPGQQHLELDVLLVVDLGRH